MRPDRFSESRVPGVRARPRRGLPRGTVVTVLGVVLWLASAGASLASESTLQERAESALMCYCGCADLTIRTCSCGTAARVKDDIARRLASGLSVDQVIAAYVAQHGEQIRSAPAKEGFNLLAWLVPFGAILAAGGLIVALVRRWSTRGALEEAALASTGASPLAGLSSADRKALDRVEREFRRDL